MMNMTESTNNCGEKNAAPVLQRNQRKPLLICLVSLMMAGCVNLTPSKATSMCDPTPPQLQWTTTADGRVTTASGWTATQNGGAYLPPRSLGALVNFIHDLHQCAGAAPSDAGKFRGTLAPL